MKKALIFAVTVFSLFIIVSFPCSGCCKKHKPAMNKDSVSKNAGSDVTQEESDDSVIDDSDLTEDNASDVATIVESNPNNAVVIVEGAGENLAEAKKDALRCAVEEVVGSLVDAQSRVENDELIEQILTASSAYVEKYSVLSRKIDNGLATVKIRATVVKESLTKKLKMSEGGQTVAIDGASLAGKAATKAESEKQGALFLANFLKNEGFPYRLIDVKIVGEPKIVQTGNEIKYTLTWEISANRERYMDFVKRLQPILDKCALRKSNFILELSKKTDSKGVDFFSWTSGQVKSLADRPNFQFYLCTGISGNFSSLKYMSYELPQKYKIPIQYYCCVVPTVNIALLNSKSEEIAISRFVLCRIRINSDLVLPTNLCAPLREDLVFNGISETGESSIGKVSDYYREGLNWLSISPFQRYEQNLKFYTAYYFSITLNITSEELEQVKSATISVIANNPDMDKAFERMADEIDKVPTE